MLRNIFNTFFLGVLITLLSLSFLVFISRKKNYQRISLKKLNSLANENRPKYIEVRGKVVSEKEVAFLGRGDVSYHILTINDGTGEIKVSIGGGFFKQAKKGDELLIRGVWDKKDLVVTPLICENLSTGKKRGTTQLFLMAFGSLIAGVVLLFIGWKEFNLYSLIISLILFIVVIVVAISFSSRTRKEVQR
jgi:hypothetical protein